MDEQENNDVRLFAERMERQLELNEWKDGWTEVETSFLIEQFRNKIHTVNQMFDMSIIASLDKYNSSVEMIQALQRFLADTANYAMMISGNIGRTLK